MVEAEVHIRSTWDQADSQEMSWAAAEGLVADHQVGLGEDAVVEEAVLVEEPDLVPD